MSIYATSSFMPIVAAGLSGPVVNSSPDLLERNGVMFLRRGSHRLPFEVRREVVHGQKVAADTPHKREDIRANIERTVPVHSDGGQGQSCGAAPVGVNP